MKTTLFTFLLLIAVRSGTAQEPILIGPSVGTEIDLAEKKQYRLFPYYSSQRFVSSSIYLMPDSTMQLRTKMTGDSVVTKTFSKQELAFLRSMVGDETPKVKNAIGTSTYAPTSNGSAQGAYISAGFGYAFPIANGQTMTESSSTSGSTSATYERKIKRRTGTFGTGLNFGFTIGFRSSNNLAFELNASFLKGSKLESSNSSTGVGYTTKSSDEIHYSGLRFTPSFKLILPGKKIDFYVRNGLVLSVHNKLTYTYDYFDTSPWSSGPRYQVTEYSGRMAFGYSGGIGFNFKLNSNMAIFAETNFMALSWAPKRSEVVESTLGGVNQLPLMNTNQKETEFFNNYSETVNYANPPVTSEPEKSLKIFLPLSSAGLNVGIHISLKKK